ncbi:hypothetical protein KZ793_06745 [Photorhabdus sp. UCH-936]|nr:hypothetical protein [Photorhabdus antumapuensis]
MTGVSESSQQSSSLKDEEYKRISLHHETIYILIYKGKIDGGDLWQHFRIASKPYHKRYGCYE